MADGRWQMADGRWQMADGRWQMRRWQMADAQMADGRWQMADGMPHTQSACGFAALRFPKSKIAMRRAFHEGLRPRQRDIGVEAVD